MENLKLIPILLPTEDASKLHLKENGELILTKYDKKIFGADTNQYLYLCSTLPIKEGDWCYTKWGIDKCSKVGVGGIRYFDKLSMCWNIHEFESNKVIKIEFTTDQKLISDGVPAIDGNTDAWISNINIKEGDKLTHIKSGEIQTFVRWEGAMFVTIYETEIGKAEDWIESSLFQFKEQEINFLEEFCKRYNQKDNQKGVEAWRIGEMVKSKMSYHEPKDWNTMDENYNPFIGNKKENQKEVDVEKLLLDIRSHASEYGLPNELYNRIDKALQSNAGRFGLEDIINFGKFLRKNFYTNIGVPDKWIYDDEKVHEYLTTEQACERYIQPLTKEQPKVNIVIECEIEQYFPSFTDEEALQNGYDGMTAYCQIKLKGEQPILIFK